MKSSNKSKKKSSKLDKNFSKQTEVSKQDKELYVTILLSESTTSLLNLSLPHLEQMHPDNSKIFIISPSYYNKIESRFEEGIQNESIMDLKNLAKPGTSRVSNDSNEVRDFLDPNKSESKMKGVCLLASDIGLFSKSNFSSNSSCMYEDCESDENLDLTDAEMAPKKQDSQLFEARKIRQLPLLTARSTAHSNKLNTHSNDIYVSLLDSSIDSTGFICRICHGGESLDDLLTPCRCRGTVALVHLKCLERWLKDSQHSSCELCQHHYKIVRKPKYSIPWSIPAYLKEPGPQLKEVLLDLVAFALYTPSAVASTYMLMMVCESLVKANIVTTGTISSHILAFSAVFGMAAIDFTYSSWLLYTCQKHVEGWREWYNSNTTLKVVLSPIKLRPRKKQVKQTTQPSL